MALASNAKFASPHSQMAVENMGVVSNPFCLCMWDRYHADRCFSLAGTAARSNHYAGGWKSHSRAGPNQQDPGAA